MMETFQRVIIKRKSLKTTQQVKMSNQNMKMNRMMSFMGNRSWESQMLMLTSILAKHCDLSDLLCILLRMHIFIIIFIALEYVCLFVCYGMLAETI